MATILAHIKIRAGKEARFEELAEELYASSHGVEKKLLRYEYWRGQEPGRYYTLLAFEDYHGFLEHESSPHHLDATPELRRIIEEIKLEFLDPVPNASPLPSTVVQGAPPNASEVVANYAKRIPVTIASWWPTRA